MAGLLSQSKQQAPAQEPLEQAPVEAPTQAPVSETAEAPADQGIAPEETDEGLFPWEEEADPEEQAAFDEAVKEAARVIYGDDGGHNSVLSMLKRGHPTTAIPKIVGMLVTEIDKKMNLPVSTVAALGAQIFHMVDDVATTTGIEMDDQDAKLALAASQQMVTEAYGLEAEELEAMGQSLSTEDIKTLKGIYEDATNGQGFA